MSQDIREFLTASDHLVALGEPTHADPAIAWVRNTLFPQLADHGFRSIALETDRVAALTVQDFVHNGHGTLDDAMRDGFSHGFGDLEANRQLVAWMRDYNEGRPPEDRLAFHGFDAATETMSAPSPRHYLEHARDYLALDLDIASLAGDDERWSRTEAVLDPARSAGDTAEADRLRSIADDMLIELYRRAAELIAVTSRDEWWRARTHLTAGLGLLRYHKQCAQRIDEGERLYRLTATRDALMAQNLMEIRELEARRGGTLVFAHNLHLRRSPSTMRMAERDITWACVGAIVTALVDERYTFVAGSLGRSDGIGLAEPDPDTYEGALQGRVPTWGLVPATTVDSGRKRTDTHPRQGYFPLDEHLIAGADLVLHVSDASGART